LKPVAAVQLRGDQGLTGNLEDAGYWIDRAVAAGAGLVVLPENFAYFGNPDLRSAALDESFGAAPARRFLADKARQHGIWLVGGTLPLFGSGEEPDAVAAPTRLKPFAASLLLDSDGREVARYDKIHLFDVSLPTAAGADGGRSYRESDNYRHGGDLVTVASPWGVLGLSVCYDLRFPELYRALMAGGADVLLVPAAFTSATGAVHWRTLLQARAIENQCYVIGANLANRSHEKTPTWGGSAIVDPWGILLGELQGEPGCLVVEIDHDRLRCLRRDMPVQEHRRFSVVKAVLKAK